MTNIRNIMRRFIGFILFFVLVTIVQGCIPSGLVVPEVSPVQGYATLVGSRNNYKGAQIDTFPVTIDGRNLDIKKGATHYWKNSVPISSGAHEVVIKAWQCHVATHTFNINFEAGKIYVAQARPLTVKEMEIWVSELNSEQPVTEKAVTQKSGTCTVLTFL